MRVISSFWLGLHAAHIRSVQRQPTDSFTALLCHILDRLVVDAATLTDPLAGRIGRRPLRAGNRLAGLEHP
jgi:hypothetical protein